MVWDFAIIYLAVSLAIAGWNSGLKNSWPTPIAMFLATIAVQSYYVDLCSWLLEETRLPAHLSFFVGYMVFWLVSEIGLEYALRVLLPINRQYTIGKISRAGAAVLGLAKAAVVVVFATAATVSGLSLPYPPEGAAIAGFLIDGSRDSYLLRVARVAASHLPDHVAQQVICWQGPSSTPTFEDRTSMNVNHANTEKYRALFNELRKLEDEVSNL